MRRRQRQGSLSSVPVRSTSSSFPSPSPSTSSSSTGASSAYTTYAGRSVPDPRGYILRLLHYDFGQALLALVLPLVQWAYTLYLSMAFGIGRWVVGSPAVEEMGMEGRKSRHRGASNRRQRHETTHAQAGSSKERTALAQQGYYPGMVNLSGVLCYMNSVLQVSIHRYKKLQLADNQSLASVTSLVEHLGRITALAIESDLATPVTDAVSDVLADLNTPHRSQPRPLRPHALLAALQTLPSIRRLTATREQQDAHELLSVLAEAISDEALKVANEVIKLRGVAEVLSLQAYCVEKGAIPTPTKLEFKAAKEQRKRAKGLAQPWEGLIARRRLCRGCGRYGEVRMDTLGGMELPIPNAGDVTLDASIAEYLQPELLSGVLCEHCSLASTLAFYQAEVARLNGRFPDTPSSTNPFASLESIPPSPSPKTAKKTKAYTKIRDRLAEMAASGSVSHFGQGLPYPGHADLAVKWQKVNADSIRETIVTRPPPTLRLHVTRTGYTPYGQLLKKSTRVAFPMILDFTRFVSGGVWDGRGEKMGDPKTVLYRLESAILHYGYTTSSGHFIAIRRKPSDQGDHFGPGHVRKSCPDGCRCQNCVLFGQVRGDLAGSVPGRGWLRVSDDDVEEVGEEALVEARSAVFMLFYERVGEYVESAEHVGRASVVSVSERESTVSSEVD